MNKVKKRKKNSTTFFLYLLFLLEAEERSTISIWNNEVIILRIKIGL
jgi:hypothetical protein